MNILKLLRRPYFTIILASLMLFVSCSHENVLKEISTQIQTVDIHTQTVEEYVIKHIELTLKMSELQNSVDYEILDKLIELQYKSVENSDLKIILQNENINISDEIFELLSKIVENTKILHNNPQYNSLNQEKFLTLISDEINAQFNDEQILYRNLNSCRDVFEKANKECLKDFASAIAVIGVVGLLTTFGVGSLIGGSIALIRFGECNKRAQFIYRKCLIALP